MANYCRLRKLVRESLRTECLFKKKRKRKKGIYTSVTFVHNENQITHLMGFTTSVSVCAFPYVMAFTPDTIEIRLIINGNLVHTTTMPDLTLITSKVRHRRHSYQSHLKLH